MCNTPAFSQPQYTEVFSSPFICMHHGALKQQERNLSRFDSNRFTLRLIPALFFYFVQVQENAASPTGTTSSRIHHPSAKQDLDHGGAPSTADAPAAPSTADAPAAPSTADAPPDVKKIAEAFQSLSASPDSQGTAYSEKVARSFGINSREVCQLSLVCAPSVVIVIVAFWPDKTKKPLIHAESLEIKQRSH